MASFDDLGRALRDDALANAPRASAIDVDAATRAARAQRRPRQWAVGTLSVVAVLGFGGLALSAVTPPALIAASESADLEAGAAEFDDGVSATRSEADAVRGDDLLSCGGAPPEPASPRNGLSLDLAAPLTSSANGDSIITVARLSNTSTSAVDLVANAGASGVLAESGGIVSAGAVVDDEPLSLSLGPGESRDLPVRLETLDCRTGAPDPLPPGAYSAVVVLMVIDVGTGARVLVVAPGADVQLE